MHYDKKLSKILCQVCIDSYEGRYGEVKNILQNVKTIEKDNVKAFVGDLKYNNENYTVIVFPGSVGLMDWIDNLKFKKIYPFNDKIGIHQGFYYQYGKIKNEVWKEVLRREGLNIIFTGHSLGGAIATIYSALNFSKFCYTFGSPRVGNKAFVKFFERRKHESYRFINSEDSVCKVPTCWMGFRYGNKIKIGQKLSWREKLLWLPRKIVGNPADHYPQRYLKNV